MGKYEHEFDEYCSKILPDKLQMFKNLMLKPFQINKLFITGRGEKGILRALGRINDFKGIYAFLEEGEVVYIGASEKVINRLNFQIKGHTKYQAHLAWEIIKNKSNNGREVHRAELDKAKSKIKKMDLVFMEITSGVERQLFEIYCSMKLNSKYNSF